jgi:hypothetical protein
MIHSDISKENFASGPAKFKDYGAAVKVSFTGKISMRSYISSACVEALSMTA